MRQQGRHSGTCPHAHMRSRCGGGGGSGGSVWCCRRGAVLHAVARQAASNPLASAHHPLNRKSSCGAWLLLLWFRVTEMV